MAELEGTPAETQDALDQIGAAGLVIGLPSCDHADSLSAAVGQIRSAVAELPGSPRTVVVHTDALEALPESAASTAPVALAPVPFPAAPESRFDSMLPVLLASRKLSAAACCVWNSAAESMTARAIVNLLRPLADGPFDLAVARYIGLRYDALINSSIVYPLNRALYGLRIRYPMAADLAFSAKLVDRLLQPDPKTGRPLPRNWIPTFATCEKLQICQAELGLRLPPPPATDASTALVNVLAPLMLDVERNALFWQRYRGSQDAPLFGVPVPSGETPRPIDVNKMIEAFQLGCRNLRDVWSPVLPPATLLQITKTASTPAAALRMSDELWARCVYDFVLGHHLRLMNADHLIRAMTPLYLAWVASYALEVQNFTFAQVEDRLEHLCLAFETQKPYFLSRWRWPDRFNP